MPKQNNVIIGIYKITSPSNKTYIGQSINIKERFKKYKNINCKSQIKIYRSIKKYGFDKHKFEVIEECSIKQLDEREIYYKKIELDKMRGNWNKVLFCELHDKGGGPRSEETKIKIGLANKGKTHSNETKLKISNSKKGIKKTIEHRLFLSKRNLNSKVYKSQVLQFSILDGEFIKEWNSIKEAEEFLNNKGISQNCRGKSKSSGGYFWKYKNEKKKR